MKLSVIIPVYNEAATVGTILERLSHIRDIVQIIVVDDHSHDETVKLVSNVKDERILLLQHSRNLGKGAAIHTALARVKGDYVLIQDADLEYDPNDIALLTQPVKDGKAEVVFGSRFLGAHTNMYLWNFLGNKMLNMTVNILFNSILSDMETCYKLMRTDLLRSLKLQQRDFRFEPEVTCKLLKKRVKIFEVPISYVGRSYEEGKKIHWSDWFKAMSVIFSVKLTGKEFILPSVEPILQHLRIRQIEPYMNTHGVLVDIGCDEPPQVLNRFKPVMKRCIGLDLIATPRNYENVEIIRADLVSHIPLPTTSATVITMLAVLEHMKHPQEIIKECYRILEKGGRLLVTVPSPQAKPLLERLSTVGLVRQEMIDQHENYFTKEALAKLAEKAGFAKIKVTHFEFGFNTLLVAQK